MANEDAIEVRAELARRKALRGRGAMDVGKQAGRLGDAVLRGPVGVVASWRAPRMERRMRILVGLGVASGSVS